MLARITTTDGLMHTVKTDEPLQQLLDRTRPPLRTLAGTLIDRSAVTSVVEAAQIEGTR